MKKLLLFTLLACLLQGVQAQELIKARIVIDDISRVTLSVNYEDYPDIVNGLNIIEVQPATTVTISAREGCRLISVTGSSDQGSTWEEYIVEQKYCELRYYSDYNETFTVVSARNQEVQSAQCTLLVDEASKIRVTRKASQTEEPLTNGENIIKFDPTNETELVIAPTGKPIYKITVDGKDITDAAAYSYTVTIADGTKIEVQANYPDVMCPVHIVLEGNGATDFITGADIDGVPTYDFKSPEFAVKAGTELKLYANTNEWEVQECFINDQKAVFSNPFITIITAETTIRINVQKYASFLMNIIIDDPTRVSVFRGYHYNGDKIDLKAGKNEVEIMRNTPIVSLVPADGCFIESCLIDDYSYSREELQVAPIRIGQLTDGSELSITSGTIVRDKQATVYLHNLSQAADFFKMLRADNSVVADLKEGYNQLLYYPYDNTFTVETGGPVQSFLYLNEKRIAPKYPESPNYAVDFQPNDVLKIFFGDEPAKYKVTFEVEDGLPLIVVRDEAVIMEDWEQGFEALQGTHVAIETDLTVLLNITVNGETLTPTESRHTIIIETDTHIVVTATGGSGITSSPEMQETPGAVYNAQGILMLQNATSADIERLPKGIYFKDGRKLLRN